MSGRFPFLLLQRNFFFSPLCFVLLILNNSNDNDNTPTPKNNNNDNLYIKCNEMQMNSNEIIYACNFQSGRLKNMQMSADLHSCESCWATA